MPSISLPRPRLAWSLAALLAPLAARLPAQPFATVVRSHFPLAVGDAQLPEIDDLVVGDIDGDGRPDVVALGSGAQVYRSEGDGGLRVVQDLTIFGALRCGALVDVDGDLDLDLVLAAGSNRPSRYQSGPIFLLRNDGGTFTDVTGTQMPLLNLDTSQLVAFDHDGDGDSDLACATDSFGLQVLDNDGFGTFTVTTAARLPAGLVVATASLLAATDLDGDGDRDLLVVHDANPPAYGHFLRNDGAGHFATAAGLLPNGPFRAVLDLDGDGDDDLLTPTLRLRNDGGLVFTPLATGVTLDCRNLRAADFDGDGRRDLVGTTYFSGSVPHVYLAQPSGAYVDAPAFLPDDMRIAEAAFRNYWVGASPLAVLDLDGDGRPDVVHSGWQGHLSASSWTVGLPPKVLVNRDGVALRDGSQRTLPLIEHETYGAFAGDLDGDGDIDLLTCQERSRILRNRGDGWFSVDGELPTGGRRGVLADLDGDGDLDLVATWAEFFFPLPGPFTVTLNQGSTWVPANPPVTPSDVADIAAGDVDGDGDVDLVLARFNPTWGADNLLLLNGGHADFTNATAGRLPPVTEDTARVLLVDVDGDRDLDLVELVIAYPAGQVRLLLNDGTGHFADVSTRLPALAPLAMAAVDFDRDGDVDIVVPGTTLSNDGTGHFAASANTLPRFDHLVDLAGTWTTVRGGLSGVTIGNDFHVWAWNQDHRVTVPFDADLDGDLDLFVAPSSSLGTPYDFNFISGVLFNLSRQLTAPRLLRVGRPWPLQVQAATPGSLAQVVVGTRALQPRLALGSLGWLGVDPSAAVFLPVVAAGTAPTPNEIPLAVPANAALVDVDLWAQALLVPPGTGLAGAALTGLAYDRATR
ncbi:MAG: VCBS repeat-containing protein [Planctomycetota bacterium]